MKTVKTLLLPLLLTIVCTPLVAGDAPSKALLIAQLKSKVTKLVDTKGLKRIECSDSTVKIEFTIDKKGKIQVQETSTNTVDLDEYIKERLNGKYHHASLAGKKFVLRLSIKPST